MMASMAMYPFMMSMGNQNGMAGFTFGGQQNFHNTLLSQEYFLQNREAIKKAQEHDIQKYNTQLLGVARLSGTNIEAPEVKRAAMAMAQDFAQMGVYMADFMPGIFDELHGIRGSEAGMARKVYAGSRYALDPITNQLGYRGASAGILTDQLFSNLFGKDADISQMKGFGGTRVGEMYDEMQRRGFLGGSAATRDEMFRNAGLSSRDRLLDITKKVYGEQTPDKKSRIDDLPLEQLRELAMTTNEGKEIITKQEADRITKSLKNMTGALAAVRDIFGENGRPNAPMPELINALQALTQGGMSTLSPEKAEAVVRDFQASMRVNGIPLQQAIQMRQRAAGLADQFGFDRTIASEIDVQSAAYGTAFGNIFGAVKGWKLPSKDEAVALNQSLLASATTSDTTVQLSATLKLAEENGGITKGSRLEKLVEAIKKGDLSYKHDGNEYKTVTSFEEWKNIITKDSSISAESAYLARTRPDLLGEYTEKYGTNMIARRSQFDTDIKRYLGMADNAYFSKLPGVDANLSEQMSNRIIQSIQGQDAEYNVYKDEKGNPLGLKPEELMNPAKRVEALTERVMSMPGAEGLDRAKVRDSVASSITYFESVMSQINPSAYQGFNRMMLFNPSVQQSAEQWRGRTRDQGDMTSVLSGIQRGTVIQNLADIVRPGMSEDDIGKVLSQALGGVQKSELADAMNEFTQRRGTLNRESPDSPRRATMIKDMQMLAEKISGILQSSGPHDPNDPNYEKLQFWDPRPSFMSPVPKGDDVSYKSPTDKGKDVAAAFPSHLTLQGRLTLEGNEAIIDASSATHRTPIETPPGSSITGRRYG